MSGSTDTTLDLYVASQNVLLVGGEAGSDNNDEGRTNEEDVLALPADWSLHPTDSLPAAPRGLRAQMRDLMGGKNASRNASSSMPDDVRDMLRGKCIVARNGGGRGEGGGGGIPPPLRRALWSTYVHCVAHPELNRSDCDRYGTVRNVPVLEYGWSLVLRSCFPDPSDEKGAVMPDMGLTESDWELLLLQHNDDGGGGGRLSPIPKSGLKSLKRVVIAVERTLGVDFCPLLPDVTAVLLTVMEERCAYATLRDMIHHGREVEDCGVGRYGYLATSRVDHVAWCKTFGDILRKQYSQTASFMTKIGALSDASTSGLDPIFKRFFVTLLKPEHLLRLMDVYVLDGAEVLFRVGTALVCLFHAHLNAAHRAAAEAAAAAELAQALSERRRRTMAGVVSAYAKERSESLARKFTTDEDDDGAAPAQDDANSESDFVVVGGGIASDDTSSSSIAPVGSTHESSEVATMEGATLPPPPPTPWYENCRDAVTWWDGVRRFAHSRHLRFDILLESQAYGYPAGGAAAAAAGGTVTAAGRRRPPPRPRAILHPWMVTRNAEWASERLSEQQEDDSLFGSGGGSGFRPSSPNVADEDDDSDENDTNLSLRPLGFVDGPVSLVLARNAQHRTSLARWVPDSLQSTNLDLIYSTNVHGRSVELFYRHCRLAVRTLTLLEVWPPKTTSAVVGRPATDDLLDGNDSNEVGKKEEEKGASTTTMPPTIVGMYATDRWHRNPNGYGDGECFVFRLTPEPQCFKWKKRDGIHPASSSIAASASESKDEVTESGGGDDDSTAAADQPPRRASSSSPSPAASPRPLSPLEAAGIDLTEQFMIGGSDFISMGVGADGTASLRLNEDLTWGSTSPTLGNDEPLLTMTTMGMVTGEGDGGGEGVVVAGAEDGEKEEGAAMGTPVPSSRHNTQVFEVGLVEVYRFVREVDGQPVDMVDPWQGLFD